MAEKDEKDEKIEELENSRDIIHTEVRTLEKVKTKVINDIEAFKVRDDRIAKLEERQNSDYIDTLSMLRDVDRIRKYVIDLSESLDVYIKRIKIFILCICIVLGVHTLYLILQRILGW